MRRRPRATLLAVLGVLSAACGALGTGTEEASIEVTVAADATLPPDAGFTLTLDGREPRLLGAEGTVRYTGVAAGSHLVHLFGLPARCEVRGQNPRPVHVSGDGVITVDFSVVCGPAESGGLDIEVTSRGEPLDDDGYQLSVAGAPLRVIPIHAREVYTGLAPGVHLVTLKDVIPECRLTGGNPQPFTIIAGEVLAIRLDVVCGPASPPD